MSSEIDYEEDLAAQHAVEDSKYDDLMGPGDDPPDDYLEWEAEQHAQRHRDDEHGGRDCDCPTPEVEYSEEAPF